MSFGVIEKFKNIITYRVYSLFQDILKLFSYDLVTIKNVIKIV